MNFEQNENQGMIAQMVRDFAEKEIKPNMKSWDDHETFPVDTMKKLGELGLLVLLCRLKVAVVEGLLWREGGRRRRGRARRDQKGGAHMLLPSESDGDGRSPAPSLDPGG